MSIQELYSKYLEQGGDFSGGEHTDWDAEHDDSQGSHVDYDKNFVDVYENHSDHNDHGFRESIRETRYVPKENTGAYVAGGHVDYFEHEDEYTPHEDYEDDD